MDYTRWHTYKKYLLDTYGYQIYRLGVDGGFSCPNRESDRTGGCCFCDGTGAVATYHRRGESRFHRDSLFEMKYASPSARQAGDLEQRLSSLDQQIEKGAAFLKRRYRAEHISLYFQAWTSTYSDLDTLRIIYEHALGRYDFDSMIVSTRPDCIERPILDYLSSLDIPVELEVGLQTANDETLSRIGRGHDVACYRDAVTRIHEYGFRICTHLIFGLPGETLEDYMNSMRLMNELKIEGVKIHNINVCGGTRLYDEYLMGEFTASSMMRHVHDTAEALRHLRRDAVVERLICETPPHRLASPRGFGDKTQFLTALEKLMEEKGYYQGDLC